MFTKLGHSYIQKTEQSCVTRPLHWLCFLLPFFLCSTSFADDSGQSQTLRIGYQSSPPYQIIEEDGTIGGIAIELVKESAERLGIELEWIYCPQSPDIHFAQKDIDLWPVVTDLPHRHEEFYITDPIYQNSLGILSRKEEPILEPSQSAGKRIAFYNREPSLTLVPKLLPNAIPVPAASHTDAIESVMTGVNDGAFLWSTKSNSVNFKLALDEHPEIAAYFYTFPDEKLNCGIAAALDNPDAIQTADRIRETFGDLVKEGFVQDVYFRYYLDPENEISSYFYLEEVKGKARTLAIATGVLVVLVILLTVMAILLQRSRRKAEVANEAKNNFLANMSHEFRTPLNGIMGMTQLAINSPLTSEQKELMETVMESAEAMLALVNDILDISKIRSGRFSVESETVELDDLLKSTNGFFAILAKQKGLEFECKKSSHCPQLFVSDTARIRQILFNLIGNAIKFTKKGKITVFVDKIHFNNSDHILFEVSDTGIGIPEAIQENIFESFTQADPSTTREFGGTGLGLAISRELARLLGGEIYLESIAGKGSVFSVLIPFEIPEASKAETGFEQTFLEKQNTYSILVVDDNTLNLRTVEAVLTRLNHKVICANSAQSALALFRSHSFDIILMDLQMPGIDGWEATRMLKAETHSKGKLPPIIALTASTYSSDLNTRVLQEMDGLILKPIVISALQTEINRVLLTEDENDEDSLLTSEK